MSNDNDYRPEHVRPMYHRLGAALAMVSMVLGGIVWFATTVHLFATDQVGLALLALVVPPADLVLAFTVSPTLGGVGLGALGLWIIGSVLTS